MAGDENAAERVRLDRWLWAARFFKTRGLATTAVNAGHVDVARGRARPSRPVAIGDELTIRRGNIQWTVVVRSVAHRRGSAGEASRLHEETEESRAARERAADRRRAEAAAQAPVAGRPTKRDRRRLDRMRRRG